MKDHISGRVLWYKFISKRETLEDYLQGIRYLEAHGCEIQAIVCDGFKGLKEHLSRYKIQHCQFHQIMTIRTKLTLHPKLPAAQELLVIAREQKIPGLFLALKPE